MEKEKTPWRKNLDKRYISGEDLLMGEEMGKGLRKEMHVTLAKYEDSPAFDQKKQEEVNKTAIWLKEYPSGKLIYKPALLNVINGSFLSKEIGNDSLFLEDFDTNKPVTLYACPDKRHGHVARFKKYIAPNAESDKEPIIKLETSKSLAELKTNWDSLNDNQKLLPTVIAKKELLKTTLI